jgi:peptidoglycan lytic transglycosylase G
LKWIKILAPFLLILLAGAAIGIYEISRYPDTVDALHGNVHTVVIEPGEGFRATSRKLQDIGLIQSPLKFRLYARLSGLHRQIKAGEYQLFGTMTPRQILATFVEGKVLLYRVTIPEGYTLRQIARTVAQAGFGSAETFFQLATDPEVLREQELGEQSLEGYLFPDTYYFPKGFPQLKIIAAMTQRFRDSISAAWQARADALGLTLHQVVTLASIIEKETGDPAERPLIASVFHNRLKKGMRLETDPTVIYGIKDFDGNLTRKHLRTPTPYNTYVIKGLPPGPIASPGHAALEAALYPAETDYLFFVSRKDRTHQFSSNLKDHQKAVRKYQLRRKRKSS